MKCEKEQQKGNWLSYLVTQSGNLHGLNESHQILGSQILKISSANSNTYCALLSWIQPKVNRTMDMNLQVINVCIPLSFSS
jgi:hypothetical protein